MASTQLAQLPSPALLFRESGIDKNLDHMVRLVGGEPQRLCPHVKTHKCPNIISRHIARGIKKFKCATVAEAEMTARNGASEVILAKQAVGPDIGRLARLITTYPNTVFKGIVDDAQALHKISASFTEANQEIGLLIDIDCGMSRTGIANHDGIRALVELLSSLTGVRSEGVHVYDGHIHDADPDVRAQRYQSAMAPVEALVATLRKEGHHLPQFVGGGSPTFPLHAQNPLVTECSPGTTVLWDAGYQSSYPDLPFEPAAFVYTRVISRLSDTVVTVDLGHKAISADKPQPRVIFPDLPGATLTTHSEEHLSVESDQCAQLTPGDALIGIPTHVCPTVALYDQASVISDDDEITDQWPIEARSRVLSI